MVAVPMKPEYGPTLGRLLAPRWQRASLLARGAAILAGIGLLALMLGAGLTLENATFSHGGSVPFSFQYRGLYRVSPDQGGYVKVEHRYADGRLKDSFAVDPLRLPPYTGELSAELAVYATVYIRELGQRYRDFVLRGEGKTKLNSEGLPAYSVFYTATVEGREVFGRDVLLLPPRPGAREGVDVVMLTSPTADSAVDAPTEVASTGVLLRPLKTLTFG